MGGSKTKTSSSQKTTSEIPAEIRERGTAISTGAMNTYFDPTQKYQPFNVGQYGQLGKDTTGQLNEFHDQAGNAITNAQSSYQPYINRADQTATNSAANNQAGQVSGPNYNWNTVQQFMNPFTEGVIDRGLSDIGRAVNAQRLDNQSRAALAGAFGGARHGVIDAEGQRTAADTAQRFITQTRSDAFNQGVSQYNTDYSQNLQAQTQNNAAKQQNWNMDTSLAQIYANLGQQTQDQQLSGAKAATDFGNIKTAQEQAEKDSAWEKGQYLYNDARDRPLEIYERLAAINAMQPINRTSTSTGTSTSKSSGGWLGPAIGAVGNIVAMSDERAKEDIKNIDPETVLAAFAKVEPKSYRYKDEAREAHPDLTAPGTRTGFMAQDLERAFKQRSGPTVGGYKTVDLSDVVGKLVAAVHGLEKRTHKQKVRS